MEHRSISCQPKRRKKSLLNALTPLLCLGVVALWVMRVRLEIDISTMLIYTGIVLMVVSLSMLNGKKEAQLKSDEAHNEKLRENMGKYNDNSIFFE